MTISMYQTSVPRLANMLKNLSAILDKAQAHAEARKIDPAVLINFRLYPDMLPMRRQVQIACDSAKSDPTHDAVPALTLARGSPRGRVRHFYLRDNRALPRLLKMVRGVKSLSVI